MIAAQYYCIYIRQKIKQWNFVYIGVKFKIIILQLLLQLIIWHFISRSYSQ